MRLSRGSISSLLLGVCGCLPTTVFAVDWAFHPSVEVSETYMDNVTLAPHGQEEHDFITQVNPGFRFGGQGRRLQADVSYLMQNLVYARDSDHNTSFQQLRARLNSEPLPDWLLLDAGYSLSQQWITPDARVPLNNLSISGNRTDASAWRVTPTLRHRLFDSTVATLQYGVDAVDYEEPSIPDASSQQTVARVENALDPGRLRWAATYVRRDIRRDVITGGYQPYALLQRSGIELGYEMTPKVELQGTAGYEDNDYKVADVEFSRRYWTVGASWNPNSRTSLSASAGERFYGHTASLDFKRRARYFNWELKYLEELQTDASVLLWNELIAAQPQFADLATNNELYLRKRFSARISATTAKSKLTVTAYHQTRDFQISDQSDQSDGGIALWDWRFSGRTTAHFRQSVIRREPIIGGTNYLLQSTAGLTRQMSRRLIGGLWYWHNQQNVHDLPGVEGYRQNSVEASLQLEY